MPVSALKLWLNASLLATTVALARADSISEKRVELLFRPPVAEQIALSPDGHYIAYTEHVGGELRIVVFDLQRQRRTARILADEDRPIPHSKEKERAQLRFLAWSNRGRLVFAPKIERLAPVTAAPDADFLASLPRDEAPPLIVAPFEDIVIAPVMAVNADGTNPQTLTDAKAFETIIENGSGAGRVRMRPPEIKGFAPGDRDHLLIETRGSIGTDVASTELYRLDVHTAELQQLHSENGLGHFISDHQGLPRLMRESEQAGTVTSFQYLPPNSSRWRKLQPPPGRIDLAPFRLSPENYFGERAMPLGFDFDPNLLIYASNAGRDTFGLYEVNLATWQRTTLALEHPHRDLASLNPALPADALVFDEFRQTFAGVRAQGPRPFTAWIDTELADVQRTLDAKFPQRSVHLQAWDESRRRFLVSVTGGTEPGRIYVYQRSDDLLVELMRGAPWLRNADLHETRFFEFAGAGGAQLSGFLTLPRTPRLNPPPLIVWFASGLPPQPHREFDPQAQVLADMGFVVCRLNQRGVLGLGARQREALRRDFDRAPLEDALAAIDWIAARHKIDRKRIATLGEGFAGQLAVRVTQLAPETFRCAVAFEPVFNLTAWVQPPADSFAAPSFAQEVNRIFLEGGGAKLHELSATAHPDALSVPVFLTSRAEQRNSTDAAIAADVSHLRSQLKRRELACVAVEINDDFTLGLPAARTRVYRELEEFFNLNLYSYNVKIGPTRVVR
jgi:hypothetical protein